MDETALQIAIEQTDQNVRLALSGPIDEWADLTPITKYQSGHLVLDLGQINRINSVGVQAWIKTMKSIPDNVSVTWEHVSTAMVMQLNMIANFRGNSEVRSFFAPYYCEKCDQEHRFLLTVEGDLKHKKPVAPKFDCPHCKKPLDFDDVEEDYMGALLEALELQ